MRYRNKMQLPANHHRGIISSHRDLVIGDQAQGARILDRYVNNDQSPPPPYQEAVSQDSGLVGLGPLQNSDSTTDIRELEFLSQVSQLRHAEDTMTLRSFLTTLLKIDYGLDRLSDHDALRQCPVANRLNQHFRLSEDLLGGNNRRAAEFFLKQTPEAVKGLNLDSRFLSLWLATYRSNVRRSKDGCYHGLFEDAPISMMAIQLWWHREEAIDAIVPAKALQLRAVLHAAMLKKQRDLFEYLRDPKDFALTRLGETIEQHRTTILG